MEQNSFFLGCLGIQASTENFCNFAKNATFILKPEYTTEGSLNAGLGIWTGYLEWVKNTYPAIDWT